MLLNFQMVGCEMVKRYGFEVRNIEVNTGVSRPIIGVFELEDGDYVKYDDYLALSEAIGAGGVSGGRITKERVDIEQQRREFEAWISEDLNVQPDEEVNYSNEYVRATMKGWMAARGIKE